MGGLAGGEAADGGDLRGDFVGGEEAAGAGLGGLAALDLDGVGLADVVFGPTKVAGCHFEDVLVGVLALGGEQAALAGADGDAGLGAGAGEGDFGFGGEGAEGHVGDAEGHVGDEEGHGEVEGALAAAAELEGEGDGLVVEEGEAGELAGSEEDVVEVGDGAGGAHGLDGAAAVAGEAVEGLVVGFDVVGEATPAALVVAEEAGGGGGGTASASIATSTAPLGAVLWRRG